MMSKLVGSVSIFWIGAAVVLGACGDSGGKTDSGMFESAGEYEGDFVDRGVPLGGTQATAGGAGGAGAFDDAAPNAGDIGGSPREVEEADIYRFDGDRLYVLNQYRGLFVFDISDPNAPEQLGRADLFGQPVEMYVRDDRVYAILRDYLEPYESDRLPDDTLRRVYSSRIVAFDLTNPEDPKALGNVALDGTIIDSRLVGDVIYAVAGTFEPYEDPFYDDCYGGAVGGSTGVGGSGAPPISGGAAGGPAVIGGPGFYGPNQSMVVTSIDISDPAEPSEVAQLDIDAGGTFVHATDEAFVIAGVDYNSPTGPQTRITYVDISDPEGQMEQRGQLTLSGEIQDDTALDMYEGQLRVLTRDWNRGVTNVRILDATDPDELPMLGELEYVYQGDVFGTTFDGDRLYMIHYFTIDPLEVIDLSDPAAPRVAGILEMPGWVDRIAALGDRLIGLGIDDSTDEQLVSVSLFDVSDIEDPQLLDRVSSGEGWSTTLASSERKAWTVDEEAGVIVFPYSSYGYFGWRQTHAISILEFDDSSLTARGEVEAPALVERGLYRDDHVYALSQAALQVVDITDRDAPELTATLELAPNVLSYVRVGDVGIALTTLGDDYARTLDIDGTKIELDRGADYLLVDGDDVLAVRTWDDCRELEDELRFDPGFAAESGLDPADCEPAGISVVSLKDPDNPELVADIELPTPDVPDELPEDAWVYSDWQGSYGPALGYYDDSGARALRFGNGKLGFIQTEEIECNSLSACDALDIEPEYVDEGASVADCAFDDCPDDLVYEEYAYGYRRGQTLHILDLAHADGPRFVAHHELSANGIEGAFASDGMFVYSRAEPARHDEEGRGYVYFYVERARIGDDGALEELPSVNVPGVVLSLMDDGVALTAQPVWVDGPYGDIEIGVRLNTIRIEDDEVTRLAQRDLGQNIAGFALNDKAAYLLRHVDARREGPDGQECYETRQLLRAIDISDPETLDETNDIDLGATYWNVEGLSNDQLVLLGGPLDGFAVFDLNDPLHPELTRYATSNGQSGAGFMNSDAFYVPAGRYGVQEVPF